MQVYQFARQIEKLCHTLVKKLPHYELYGLSSQIRRAAGSVKLNIAEGAARKTPVERRRFFEISRSSLVEVDAAFETAVDVGYLAEEDLTILSGPANSCFALISALISNTK